MERNLQPPKAATFSQHAKDFDTVTLGQHGRANVCYNERGMGMKTGWSSLFFGGSPSGSRSPCPRPRSVCILSCPIWKALEPLFLNTLCTLANGHHSLHESPQLQSKNPIPNHVKLSRGSLCGLRSRPVIQRPSERTRAISSGGTWTLLEKHSKITKGSRAALPQESTT